MTTEVSNDFAPTNLWEFKMFRYFSRRLNTVYIVLATPNMV